MKLSKADLELAAQRVYTQMAPTPQYTWPLLAQRLGSEVWVKHENHTPTGAFKVRGGITFIDWLQRTHPDMRGICTATRGNHGQSQARAATAAGLTARVYVPHGNSVEKNAAMRAFGAGAAPLAALMQERERMAGRKVGVILCGGNIDTDWLLTVLGGGVPRVS